MDDLHINQRISKNIRKLRNEHNMSAAQLADKLSVSRTTIHSWESGKSVPTATYIGMIATLFDVSVDSICSVYLQPRIDLHGLTYEEIEAVRSFANFLKSKHNTVTK